MASRLARIPPEINRLYRSVARAQALFSPLLPPDLERCAVDYYLIYRFIDDIEDSAAPDRAERLDAIARDVLSVLDQYPEVLAFHRSLSEKERTLIENTGRFMAKEMAEFVRRNHCIENFEDLDRYCYAVAGCVGELNSKLFGVPGGAELGNYLQIVNIIRDRESDRVRIGHSLLPEPLDEVIAHARKKESAIEQFIGSLSDRRSRRYCETLYRVARLHFDAGGERPSARAFSQVLPAELKMRFLFYKLTSIVAFARRSRKRSRSAA